MEGFTRTMVFGAVVSSLCVYGWRSFAEGNWLNVWILFPVASAALIPVLSFFSGKLSVQELKGAKLGIGTLVEMRRTGVSVNDQPQMHITLDVDTADGGRFRATAREVVELSQLGLLVPGATLPVRYLPEQTNKIAIDSAADPDEVKALLYKVRLAQGKITPQQIKVATEGVMAQAVVMGMRPTGDVRQGDAVVELQLKVIRPDGSSFTTQVEKVVGAVGIPFVQPGMVLAAKYLPENERDVSIEIKVG